jgi:hypothetical protein
LEVLGMKAAVVYESMFGNTKMIADAVADGLAQSGAALDVVVRPVTEATPEDLVGLDFLVVGGPTHLRRMTSRRTREMRVGSRANSSSRSSNDSEAWAQVAATGVREWLAGLSDVATAKRAAVFDTRLRYFPADGAAPLIARCLRARGYRVEAVPRGFLVESALGPIVNGGTERAKVWGTVLGDQLLAPCTCRANAVPPRLGRSFRMSLGQARWRIAP